MPNLQKCIALLTIALLASCGGHRAPFAVLVITPKDPVEVEATTVALQRFAEQKELRRVHPARATNEWPELKRRQDRTVHYISTHGFYFSVYTSPNCIVVTWVERERSWTERSLKALKELHGVLNAVANERVKLASPPSAWEHAEPSAERYCQQRGLLDQSVASQP